MCTPKVLTNINKTTLHTLRLLAGTEPSSDLLGLLTLCDIALM